MLKVEKIKSYLNCVICFELLNEPVSLPCGEMICSKHIDEYSSKEFIEFQDPDNYQITFECCKCESVHNIPEEGFYRVKALEKILELEVEKIKSTKFSDCKIIIDELQEQVELGENILSDAELFIFEYFGKIKKEVSLQRETLKNNIDNYYELILEKVESSELDCYKIAENTETVSTQLNYTRNELKQLTEELDSFNIDDTVYQSIENKAINLKPKFLSLTETLKNNLLGNILYKFNPKEMNVEDMFGSFEIVRLDEINYIIEIDLRNNVQILEFFWKLKNT